MNATRQHRLAGLESDNLLAFLALLGLLRALEASDLDGSSDRQLHPRAGWDIEAPPLRPVLYVAQDSTAQQIAEAAAAGIDRLAPDYQFGNAKDPNYSPAACREILRDAIERATTDKSSRADLLAALMTDAAVKGDKEEVIDPSPLCLLYGQGHQHFLERLAQLPIDPAPPRRQGRQEIRITPADCLAEALFEPWRRIDTTFSFRWDPAEDVRYALMAGNPTDKDYKSRTQHGANRLAAIGFAALTVVPRRMNRRIRPAVVGGTFVPGGRFSFAWPIWKGPATLATIRALLAHPHLRDHDRAPLPGVNQVLVANRISVGKFMNFSRARPM